eukprot:scaffold23133_cov27-Prasinocladus_malaysianus.AAC.1
MPSNDSLSSDSFARLLQAPHHTYSALRMGDYRAALEGQLPKDHVPQAHGQRPAVGLAAVVRLGGALLGAHEGRCARGLAHGVAALKHGRGAKVSQLQHALLFRHQHVVRLDVAVDDAICVQVV